MVNGCLLYTSNKVKRLALLSVLSDKAANGNMVVVDKFTCDEYKTKAVVAMLNAVGAGKKNQMCIRDRVLTLRTRTETYALLLSARSGSARVCLTEESFENPETPPSFCMLMRKHLTGGKLLDVRMATVSTSP